MRKLLFASLTVILLIALFAAYHLWRNNRAIDAPSRALVSAHLEKGIGWLMNNRETILDMNNAMLWLFIKESADITRDERLQAIFLEYKRRYLDPYPRNIWRYLFESQARTSVALWELGDMPDYNLYFVFGATCSPMLAQEEIIRQQNDPEYCNKFQPFSPACVTHQMMGVRLAQRKACIEPPMAQTLVRTLQKKIIRQLVWDPRVVDVYIQRALMLAESGASKEIKPIWLQRILDVQYDDGGWSNFYLLFPISHVHFIGFKGHYIELLKLSEIRSNFHATAQGVYLLSLVLNERVEESTAAK